jgi:predicted DNA binding protein
MVTRRFDAEVLAKREEEREIETAQEFRNDLHDRLTDRQETVLRTAFLADYFESPRGSAAEEVAAALDITAPTLLYHLRAGQRKLLEEFFQSTEPESRQ